MSKPKAAGPRCPHNDCQYRARDVLGNPRPWGCNYSDITGHTRNKAFGGICPPDRCPFYDPGERQRMRVAPFASAIGPIVDNRPLIRRGKHYDWEGKAKPMWLAGASDEEVAAVMGCNPSFAGKRRREMGIPGINTRTRKRPRPSSTKSSTERSRPMDKYDATEQAYRNGYAAGFEDARKQYRPCKMGDMVWGIRRQAGIYNHVKYGRVSHMEYSQDMELLVTIRNACKGVWGKTVFATKEEAMEALERIERRYG